MVVLAIATKPCVQAQHNREFVQHFWGLQLVLKTAWPALAAKACACIFAVYMASTALEAAGQVTAPTAANQGDQVATWWVSAQRDHDNRKADRKSTPLNSRHT